MKKLRQNIFIIFLTFLLSACGTQTSPGPEAPTPQTEVGASGPGTSNGETTHPSGFSFTDTPLTVVKYEPIVLPGEPVDYTDRTLFTDTYGSKLYLFACYRFATEAPAYILYTYDTDTGKTESLPFSFVAAGYENLSVESMDVINRDGLCFSFRISATHTKNQTEETLLYRAAETGHYLSMKSTFPSPEEYPWNPLLGTHSLFLIPRKTVPILQPGMRKLLPAIFIPMTLPPGLKVNLLPWQIPVMPSADTPETRFITPPIAILFSTIRQRTPVPVWLP